jgi:hypothetical protein
VNKNKHNIAPLGGLRNNAPANLANYQGTLSNEKDRT